MKRPPNRRRIVTALCWMALSSGSCLPQQAPAPGKTATEAVPPQKAKGFEVASIRAVPPSEQCYTSIETYGSPHFSSKCASLSYLLSFAYGVNPTYFIDAPKGLDSARFDLDTKIEGDVPSTYELLKPLMQQLLAQRFGLVAHTSTKQTAGYDLYLLKDGSKLTRATAAGDAAYIFADRLQAPGVTLAQLTGMLAAPLHRPVVDKTALSGIYNIQLKFAPLDAVDSTSPSIFTALKEQLGLKLQPSTVPVDTLVIEHINLAPTAN